MSFLSVNIKHLGKEVGWICTGGKRKKVDDELMCSQTKKKKANGNLKTGLLQMNLNSNVDSKILFHPFGIHLFSHIIFVPGSLIFSLLLPVPTTDRPSPEVWGFPEEFLECLELDRVGVKDDIKNKGLREKKCLKRQGCGIRWGYFNCQAVSFYNVLLWQPSQHVQYFSMYYLILSAISNWLFSHSQQFFSLLLRTVPRSLWFIHQMQIVWDHGVCAFFLSSVIWPAKVFLKYACH